MNRKTILQIVGFLSIVVCFMHLGYAENIDPDDDGSQYAYGENVGWVNFEPNIAEPNVGATVEDDKLTGFVWAENIGWINLDPDDDDPDTGITNDGNGNLSGYAWGENVGWINFNPNVAGDPNNYGVTIDSNGDFAGWAWGENIGWVHFRFRLVELVNFKPFANFAVQWRQTGPGLEADLFADGSVNWDDLSVFANHWLKYCPNDWEICPPRYANLKTSWTAP